MNQFTASAVQQQVKIYDSPLDYQVDIFKFLQMAQARRAKLVVFPALSPLMLIPPLAFRTRSNLLKKGKAGAERLSGLVGKLLDKAVTTASQVKGGIQGDLLHLLEHYPGEIFDAYIDLFSAAALRYKMTLVAGSFYLREHEEGDCAHIAYVFSPNGMVLGRQKKIHLTPLEAKFCQPGDVLHAIETPVGRLGILINEDMLYPECGRVLAAQGVEILVGLTAVPGRTPFRQMRHAFLARVDENEVVGVQSVLTGANLLQPGGSQLTGQAALLLPFQLSPKGDGLLAEWQGTETEGLIAERVDLDALKDYWIRPLPRLRQSMRMSTFSPLAGMYARRKTLDQLYWNPADETTPMPRTAPTGDEPAASPAEGALRSPFVEDNQPEE